MPTDAPALAPDHRGPFQVQVPDHDRMPGRAPKPSCRASPMLKSSDACAREQAFPSRHPSPDLTGRWEDDQGRFNLFINHVGTHIECLIALAANGYNPRARSKKGRPVVDDRWRDLCARMFADRDEGSPQVFTLDARDDLGSPLFPAGAGALEVGDYGTLMLFLHHPELPAELRALDGAVCNRVDDEPSLFEGHLGFAQVPGLPILLRTAHWFPLTRIQVGFLEHLIVTHRAELRSHEPTREADLEEMIQAFLSAADALSGQQSSIARQKIAESIDGLVEEVIARAQTTAVIAGGIHEAQQDFHRAIMQRVLTGTFVRLHSAGHVVEHSLLTWLGEVLDRTPDELRLDAIPKHLGLRSSYGIVYEARLDLHAVEGGVTGTARELSKVLRGIPFSAGVYQGTLRVKATGARAWDPVTYDILIGFVGVGQGVGIPTRIIAEGKTRPTSARRPEELEGICFMEELSVGVSIGGGKSYGGAVLTVGATGPGHALGFDFSGSSVLSGLVASAGIAVHLGAVKKRSSFDRVGELEPTWEIPITYSHEVRQLYQNHYSINNALLMPDAMALLDEVMATELVLLSSDQTEIEIEGFADRSGPEDFNEKLSSFRAKNAMMYMKTGSRRIHANITPKAQGEVAAGDDGTSNILYRRVDIAIEGIIEVGMKDVH